MASQQYSNYLEEIARNYSIPVIDYEIDRFLCSMPIDAIVLDISGCWGWHWRRLENTRPNIGVVIVDFVRGNLRHAKKVLGPLIGRQVALVHADATKLPFRGGDALGTGFNDVWTVQTFQHIPDYAQARREAHRVLETSGRFVTYSLAVNPLMRAIYLLAGRRYKIGRQVDGTLFLQRANGAQFFIVQRYFNYVEQRFSKHFFHPEVHFTFSGRAGSLTGRIDAWLNK